MTTRNDIRDAVLNAARRKRRIRLAKQAGGPVALALVALVSWQVMTHPTHDTASSLDAQRFAIAADESAGHGVASADLNVLTSDPSVYEHRAIPRPTEQTTAAHRDHAGRIALARAEEIAIAVGGDSEAGPDLVQNAFIAANMTPVDAPSDYLLSDDELLEILAEMGRPSGIVHQAGRTIVAPHDGRPLFVRTGFEPNTSSP
ncbi:MAG: hypothetical protein AAGB51_09515 [Planctomycetota bacterium]